MIQKKSSPFSFEFNKFKKENLNKERQKQEINTINFMKDINKENFEFTEDKKDIFKSNITNIKESQIEIDNPILFQLIEFGIEPKYSKRIFQYFHPQNIDEALDYLETKNGVVQHGFINDRNKMNKNCYLCGEARELHIINSKYEKNSNQLDINLSHENINNLPVESENINLKEFPKKLCEICSEDFVSNDENTVKNCKHSFCNDCWYDFLSVKIKENKLTSIFFKCLKYECQEKIFDKFVLNLLWSDDDLIKKYKKYKLKLEILNNPNKKLCPFPNCDSYLELEDIKNKDDQCKNNHNYCFLCLNKPHGKLKCNSNLDNDMIEFAKNHFIKKCPQCQIIKEKSSGCNHITCSKCNYQWCWLCNKKHEIGHYNQGKCKGFQYFKPNNEYEINLAFDGKIQL